jgi:hypothetical protein
MMTCSISASSVSAAYAKLRVAHRAGIATDDGRHQRYIAIQCTTEAAYTKHSEHCVLHLRLPSGCISTYGTLYSQLASCLADDWKWGSKISYVRAGRTGPPLLLVHGFGVGAYHFFRNIPELARNHKVGKSSSSSSSKQSNNISA